MCHLSSGRPGTTRGEPTGTLSGYVGMYVSVQGSGFLGGTYIEIKSGMRRSQDT